MLSAGSRRIGFIALLAALVPDARAAATSVEHVLDHGFENVSVDSIDSRNVVAFENRRFRHTARALGLLDGAGGEGAVFVERRLGMNAAAIRRLEQGARAPGFMERLMGVPDEAPRFAVSYPSDRRGIPQPSGPVSAPTNRSIDLEIGPVLAYELGRVFDPFIYSLDLETSLRYNPWPGARLTASVLIPVHNDFKPTELAPDRGELRPGTVSLEQYAWLPGVALVSGSAGYFGENRYGASFGLARPLAGGQWLLDAQADITGFVTFQNGGSYSSLSRWTGYAGATWRAPVLDVSVSARAFRWLYGDEGFEYEVRRAMGDFELAFFTQRSEGQGINGTRVVVPIPPMVRQVGSPVRLQPVERFSFSYRDQAVPLGTELSGTASREKFLRDLNSAALESNAARFHHGRTGMPPQRPKSRGEWLSFQGMTGFINTPWAGTVRDRGLGMVYNRIPRKWAYDNRGKHDNEIYSATVGFLPRLEVAIRWTRIVGLRDFADVLPESELPDLDRILSGRIALLEPADRRPGLAVGIEDIQGTRRFHSTYVVTGMPARIFGMHTRMTIGYAPQALTAVRHVLDGGFGAFEVNPWEFVGLQAEYDSEKWNIGVVATPGLGLRFRAAALNAESVSWGFGWAWPL